MKRLLNISGLFALGAVLLSSALYGQHQDEALPPRPVALSVGFSSRIFFDANRDDARAITEVWVKTLIRELNETVEEPGAETAVFNDSSEMIRALRAGGVDLLILLPLEHLEIRKAVPLEPILTGVAGVDVAYKYILLVRRDMGIGDLHQLKERELVVDMATRGNIPQMWLDTVLMKNGLPDSQDLFGRITEVNKSRQAVLAVFLGRADICLVSRQAFETMVELNPQLRRELEILAESPDLTVGLVCARKAIYDKYKGLIQEGLVALNTKPQGRQLLTIFRLNALVPFEPVHLERILVLLEEYSRLKPDPATDR